MFRFCGRDSVFFDLAGVVMGAGRFRGDFLVVFDVRSVDGVGYAFGA